MHLTKNINWEKISNRRSKHYYSSLNVNSTHTHYLPSFVVVYSFPSFIFLLSSSTIDIFLLRCDHVLRTAIWLKTRRSPKLGKVVDASCAGWLLAQIESPLVTLSISSYNPFMMSTHLPFDFALSLAISKVCCTSYQSGLVRPIENHHSACCIRLLASDIFLPPYIYVFRRDNCNSALCEYSE